MKKRVYTRREFVITGALGTLTIASGMKIPSAKPVVSVVRIRNGDTGQAVRDAIYLLGGIGKVTAGKKRIMLKPNLVGPDPRATTKPDVIRALAEMMLGEGKEVCIAEGSAAAPGFNISEEGVFYTKDPDLLDPMQQYVFDQLGYTELAADLKVPLINLHTGEMVTIDVPEPMVYDQITVNRALSEVDMLCSVPMMKTHVLATVTLGMKNLIGLYPGQAYCTVRSCVHNDASAKGSPGIAFEILDMVKACTPGLVVIDGSVAMEGNGPSEGDLVDARLIIAGTHPLATDMVAADLMGFHPEEVPLFRTAIQSGMRPANLGEIEVLGEQPGKARMAFRKPDIVPWPQVSSWFGAKQV